MLSFNCPNCRKTLKAPPEKAGAKAACPACRHTVVVPAPEEPVLEVLPVEEEPTPKEGPPPQPPVAKPAAGPPPAQARPPIKRFRPSVRPGQPSQAVQPVVAATVSEARDGAAREAAEPALDPTPAGQRQPPRPEPKLRGCRRWEEVASVLADEDEGERAVEVAGPVVDEVRRRLDQYAAAVPHHRVGGFGSRGTVRSLAECCVFTICLKAVFETRRLGEGEAPYFGWKIPAREFTAEGLDLWDFRYRCGADVAGRSEHVIPASQKTLRCDQCSGQGGVACATCRGGRVVACQKCGGGGTEACGRCGGSGIVYVDAGTQQRWVNCTLCGGSGEAYACEPGRERCRQCAGRGVVPQDQHTSQPVPCTCRTGRVACSNCRGSKQVACTTCTGTGSVPCGRCRGGKQLVRYASVVRTLEPTTQTMAVPGDGCDRQIVDLLTQRTRSLALLQITASDLPSKPLDGLHGHRLVGKVREMLEAIRTQATPDRRVACLELEVSRTVALKAEYEFTGQRYAAWLLGKEKVVHAPTSPVTDALGGKLRQAAKQWRQQQKKEAVAVVREAVEMGQKDQHCQAALNAKKKEVPSDLWEAATNPGVFESIKNFFGNLFG